MAALFKANHRVFFIGTLIVLQVSSVQAQVFDFSNRIGGANIYAPAGQNICIMLGASQSAAGPTVNFTLWSLLPAPYMRVGKIYIDTGRHTGLLRDISVMLKSPGIDIKAMPPHAHPYLPGWSPDYLLGTEGKGSIGPNQIIVMSATLRAGASVGDVIRAMQEGANPATAASGLRIGVIAYHLGGEPLPSGTRGDDAGFTTSLTPGRCARR